MCGQKENDMDDRIEELLSKKADGELTGEEERELEAWRAGGLVGGVSEGETLVGVGTELRSGR